MMHTNKADITLEEKRCFVLGLTESEIQTMINNDLPNEFEEVSLRTGFSPEMIRMLLNDQQTVANIRLNPNEVRLEQLEQLPQLSLDQAKIMLSGCPYYTIEELSAATTLPRSLLLTLFHISPFRFQDKKTATTVNFAPISGQYIIPAWHDLEAEDPLSSTGYLEITSPASGFDYRIVKASNFEAELAPHWLKATFNGAVYPVFQDMDGCERYLVPGSIDVWFKASVPQTERAAILNNLDLQGIHMIEAVGYYQVKLRSVPANINLTHAVFNVIEQIQQLDEVDFAEPDQFGFEDFGEDVSIPAIDDDLEATDRFWNHGAIQLAQAHAITYGSPKVTIFVIDSGVRMDHFDLTPAFRSDWRALDLNFELGVPEAEISPYEQNVAHGTKVTGIVGGQAQGVDNQVQGIAPGCRVLPIKISGQGVTPAYGLRAAAIRQALTYLGSPDERGVINISWRTNGEHIGIREALREAQRQNVAIVASAGNYGLGAQQTANELHYPSAYVYRYPQLDTLCSVGAVGNDDHKANYSFYGDKSVSVMAPGGEAGGAGIGIYTTSTPEYHAYTRGTSFAAPHVAGVIALLFSARPTLTAAEAIQIIKETADPIDQANPAYVGKLGAGRINAAAALARVSDNDQVHTITATAGDNGTIAPNGLITVGQGEEGHFTIKPNPGYRIAQVTVDQQLIGAVSDYTFHQVSGNHKIEARFASIQQDEHQELHYDESGRLRINVATVSELTTLPWIGLWLAKRIVQYRESYGPFAHIWELVPVIQFSWLIPKLAPLITFNE